MKKKSEGLPFGKLYKCMDSGDKWKNCMTFGELFGFVRVKFPYLWDEDDQSKLLLGLLVKLKWVKGSNLLIAASGA